MNVDVNVIIKKSRDPLFDSKIENSAAAICVKQFLYVFEI